MTIFPCSLQESLIKLPGLIVMSLILINDGLFAQTWVERGPNPNTEGQVEGIHEGEVVGAVNAVAPHPSNANIVVIGTANGGIWKTTNALEANPHWENLTPDQESLSIGAVEFDATDGSHQTLVAGFGRFSSFVREGGPLLGILRSTNGGQSWTNLGESSLKDLNISGLVALGSTIVVSVNTSGDGTDSTPLGIWRSTDTGTTWVQVSGGDHTGLPTGEAFDLISCPDETQTIFTNAGSAGLFRSQDGGATWTKISNAEVDSKLSGASNCRWSAGPDGNVFVAIVRVGRLAEVFYSADFGDNWKGLGVPTTLESSGGAIGIHPGGQGAIHLSIAADRAKPTVVYVGGDRQPSLPSNPRFPNSIGALDYSGRLFRADAAEHSTRWLHITHNATSNGGGTANKSSPHADSRDMDVDAQGDLIEVDDGGIYRRSNPHDNTGDWTSMIGDLGITEFHAVAWDSVTDILVGGAQDTGSPQSRTNGSRWDSISTADGGSTVVDDFGIADRSTRYSSWQNLGGFRRRTFDANNQLLDTTFPPLQVVDASGQPILHASGQPVEVSPQFYTPIAINSQDSDRMLLGGNILYESFDQCDTLVPLTPFFSTNGLGHEPLAYGASDNPEVIYAGSKGRVYVRTAAFPTPLTRSTAYTGGVVLGIAINPNDSKMALVADTNNVYLTKNAGQSWTLITNNLTELRVRRIHAIAYRPQSKQIIIGAHKGVFTATAPAYNWTRLGTGLPRAPVYHLEYDVSDDLLLAGTLGRGAWILDFSTPDEN
ncbi:hypothetical protein AB1K70_25390 [Bremerella sp. JC770]|uniref:WD40/YVTN/BNR-like repeat-containing protein n=1 Tax=Bremerella sp. JC770 TaxID=3232137 RepID=UPI003459B294